MPFLVIDDRYGTPIHVFLDDDPRGAAGFPGLPVRAVRLVTLADADRQGSSDPAIGQAPGRPAEFREFGSDRDAGAAGFGLIAPRYVGRDWATYVGVFGPAGDRARTPRPRSAR